MYSIEQLLAQQSAEILVLPRDLALNCKRYTPINSPILNESPKLESSFGIIPGGRLILQTLSLIVDC